MYREDAGTYGAKRKFLVDTPGPTVPFLAGRSSICEKCAQTKKKKKKKKK